MQDLQTDHTLMQPSIKSGSQYEAGAYLASVGSSYTQIKHSSILA